MNQLMRKYSSTYASYGFAFEGADEITKKSLQHSLSWFFLRCIFMEQPVNRVLRSNKCIETNLFSLLYSVNYAQYVPYNSSSFCSAFFLQKRQRW